MLLHLDLARLRVVGMKEREGYILFGDDYLKGSTPVPRSILHPVCGHIFTVYVPKDWPDLKFSEGHPCPVCELKKHDR